MQSYNHSAWNPPRVYTDPSNYNYPSNDTHPGHSTYRHQAAPAPQHPMPAPRRSNSVDAPPLPPLPPCLTPGGRNRGQPTSNNSPDLFFEQRSDYSFPRRTSDVASRPQSNYTNGIQRHTQSFTAGVPPQQPPMPPRKPVELQQVPPPRPPLPPKYKPSYSSLPAVPAVPPKIALYSQSIPSPVSNPWPPEKPQANTPPDEDKDLEIAMRLSEGVAKQRQQEEEDLAKVLEESRIQIPSAASSPIAVEVTAPDDVGRWDSRSSALSPRSSTPSRPTNMDRSPVNVTLMQSEGSASTSPPMRAAQLSDDEALARRLAAGNESESVEELQSPMQDNAQIPTRSQRQSFGVSSIMNLSVDPSASRSEPIPESTLSRDNSVKSSSSQQSAKSDPRSLLSPTSPGALRGSSPVPRPATTDPSSSFSAAWPSAEVEKRRLSVMTSQSTTPLIGAPPAIQANQFVEQELLLGVSLGFTAPAISTVLQPMSGPMPNIITLPYGKSPPLHLQAPSWRHLLKLMARLSGTRIEPTLEAMAIANGELQLRTVVQFVRVHRSAQEWRMLLYLTIDHPVPPNSPNAWKYTNGDVSTLPYSYTLSALPTLLRDGAESAMAIYYVIPSTPKTPYPTLPINFPNMAMYLQSALEDSRRAMHDSSSGLRKLAKSVDSYYSNEHEFVGVDEGPERRSFGGVFKKVIGRGNKQSNRGGNAETYELVTPFVPEEWG